ncbi:hypothetical protein FKM82_005145 [Ascaphus truei]
MPTATKGVKQNASVCFLHTRVGGCGYFLGGVGPVRRMFHLASDCRESAGRCVRVGALGRLTVCDVSYCSSLRQTSSIIRRIFPCTLRIVLLVPKTAFGFFSLSL